MNDVVTPHGIEMEIPYQSFLEMKGEFLEYVEGKSIKARFPIQKKYENPAHVVQGGFITAAIDNALGAFSFLVANKPTTSLDLNTSYIRGITLQDQDMIIEIELTSQSTTFQTMSGKVLTPTGKLIATTNERESPLVYWQCR
ncbi:MAG: acyl-coenzyme A thioesterase PaaI-like protein [bacterium]|jgi:acyl-coenzyme A thioesterase PaaI-like protein